MLIFASLLVSLTDQVAEVTLQLTVLHAGRGGLALKSSQRKPAAVVPANASELAYWAAMVNANRKWNEPAPLPVLNDTSNAFY